MIFLDRQHADCVTFFHHRNHGALLEAIGPDAKHSLRFALVTTD